MKIKYIPLINFSVKHLKSVFMPKRPLSLHIYLNLSAFVFLSQKHINVAFARVNEYLDRHFLVNNLQFSLSFVIGCYE